MGAEDPHRPARLSVPPDCSKRATSRRSRTSSVIVWTTIPLRYYAGGQQLQISQPHLSETTSHNYIRCSAGLGPREVISLNWNGPTAPPWASQTGQISSAGIRMDLADRLKQ